MDNIISKIFRKERNITIGAIHFPPLLGYADFPGFDAAAKNALRDLEAFKEGGADGIIFENNYDLPHREFVSPGTIASMALLGKIVKENAKVPVGVNVLWNDYYSSLSLAKALDLQFIRIPVFVDKVKASCGVIKGEPKKILAFRKSIGAENIALLTDIHVKHSVLLSQKDILVSAKKAIANHADAVIVTGNWTGQAPELDELKKVRDSVADFPIFVGSGTDKDNIKNLSEYANGFIVSTSLKKGKNNGKEINVKAYCQRISKDKTSDLVGRLE